MPANLRAVFCAVALMCAYAWSAVPTGAAEPVTAELRDGRSVTGLVDARTDAHQLWLRRASDNVELISGFAWSQVLGGRTTNLVLGPAELRSWAESQKQAGRRFAQLAASTAEHEQPKRDSLTTADIGPVKTLLVKAHVAQWDKDAQPDGLRIFVSPLDAQGRIVPINGRIEFTLVAELDQLQHLSNAALQPRFIEGDRLSFVVKPEHFDTGSAFYELAFSKWHPDFEPQLATQALLYARLSVPGQGVFEASDAQICLREPSRFRDQLQYFTPGRYLPLESNGQANR